MDEFHKRLEDSMNRVRKRPEHDPHGADVPPPAHDEFEERLRRAVQTNQRGAGVGDPGSAGKSALPSPVVMEDVPPDLRIVVENWPRLPGFVRAFIVNMVQANREPQAA